MKPSLSDQIITLERKAERFDDAVERIMELKSFIEHFERGDISQAGVMNKVKGLVNFYEPSSNTWLSKIKEQGYQQGKLDKYSSSKFNGEIIKEVKANKDGDVFAITESGEHYIANMTSSCNYKQSLDYILCDIQDIDTLELIK